MQGQDARPGAAPRQAGVASGVCEHPKASACTHRGEGELCSQEAELQVSMCSCVGAPLRANGADVWLAVTLIATMRFMSSGAACGEGRVAERGPRRQVMAPACACTPCSRGYQTCDASLPPSSTPTRTIMNHCCCCCTPTHTHRCEAQATAPGPSVPGGPRNDKGNTGAGSPAGGPPPLPGSAPLPVEATGAANGSMDETAGIMAAKINAVASKINAARELARRLAEEKQAAARSDVGGSDCWAVLCRALGAAQIACAWEGPDRKGREEAAGKDKVGWAGRAWYA